MAKLRSVLLLWPFFVPYELGVHGTHARRLRRRPDEWYRLHDPGMAGHAGGDPPLGLPELHAAAATGIATAAPVLQQQLSQSLLPGASNDAGPSTYHHIPGQCDLLPPARIWSHSTQVPDGGSLGPMTPAPQISLMTRTFHGERQVGQLGKALICLMAMVPSHEMDMIIVLDAGPKGEELAKCLLKIAEGYGFTGLRVALEPMPAAETFEDRAMFFGKLEGPPGKDRSQYSNFVADRYTNAPVLGMFDAETCFQVPVLPEFVIRDPGLGDGSKRIHNFIEAGGSSWGVDDRIIGNAASGPTLCSAVSSVTKERGVA